jgi:hypothetical protein
MGTTILSEMSLVNSEMVRVPFCGIWMTVNLLGWKKKSDFSSNDFWGSLQGYIEKVIYCGTQNKVLLPVYCTTKIHIQK